MPRLPRAEIRSRSWTNPEAKRERAQLKRELNSEARAAFAGPDLVERLDTNLRALEVATGLDRQFLADNFRSNRGFDALASVSIDNRSLVSFVRKVERMRNKGLTELQIQTNLISRLDSIKGLEDSQFNNLLDLVREAYGTERIRGRFFIKPRVRKGKNLAA